MQALALRRAFDSLTTYAVLTRVQTQKSALDMARKQIVIDTAKHYGRLRIIKLAGKDRSRSLLVLCDCDCGQTIISRLSKVTSTDPTQWTHSCGCLKAENYLRHWADLAAATSIAERASMFQESCNGQHVQQIAAKHHCPKELVDSVIHARNAELRAHPLLTMITDQLAAGTPYAQIAAAASLAVHEVVWLAKRISPAVTLATAATGPKLISYSVHQCLVHAAFAELADVQIDMFHARRKYMLAHEWTRSATRKSTLRFAYYCWVNGILLSEASTPSEWELLNWFQGAITRTIAHRSSLRRLHVMNAAPVHLPSPDSEAAIQTAA
jgi:hypothetical protein